jgi:hypothetical protein
MNLTKFARNNQRNILVVALAAACFLPAIIIGAVNAPRINPTVLAKPFKPAKPEPPLKRMIPEGAAFPAPSPELAPEPNVITIPMVYVMGDVPKKEIKELEASEPPTFIHESANGGKIRVIGFEPNH